MPLCCGLPRNIATASVPAGTAAARNAASKLMARRFPISHFPARLHAMAVPLLLKPMHGLTSWDTPPRHLVLASPREKHRNGLPRLGRCFFDSLGEVRGRAAWNDKT